MIRGMHAFIPLVLLLHSCSNMSTKERLPLICVRIAHAVTVASAWTRGGNVVSPVLMLVANGHTEHHVRA